MNRLTAHNYERDLFKDIYCKLSQLEDLEEKLGVEINILFQALKNGFYYKYFDYDIKTGKEIFREILFADPENEECGIECYNHDSYGIVWAGVGVAYVKDYGTTWSLRKEDLEQ